MGDSRKLPAIFAIPSVPATRRGFLAGAAGFLVVAPLPALASTTPCNPQEIVFVCRFGTVKSPIAREHFRRRAAERGLAVKVQSRGLTPEDHISAKLSAALRADRIDPRGEPIVVLSNADLTGNRLVVAFDPPSADARLKGARDWSDLPSMNADYDKARADLVGRIDRLLDELAAKPC